MTGLADTASNSPNVEVHSLPSSVADKAPVPVDHGPTVLQAHTWLAWTVHESFTYFTIKYGLMQLLMIQEENVPTMYWL